MPDTRSEAREGGALPGTFHNLRALFLNCTLKRSGEQSHTDGLIEISRSIMADQGVHAEVIRPVDHEVAPGVEPDMTDHGLPTDAWPHIQARVEKADILVVTTPIWLGERSSVCSRVIERLYANSSRTNDKGQFLYYGKVGGVLITGNEDGGKHCAMSILYALGHMGYSIPPAADAYWVGEAGPGPSYLDPDSSGPQNDWTNRNTRFMTWNLLHTARMLADAGGFPAHGNVKGDEARQDDPNPEYR